METARLGSGARTEAASTKAMEPPVPARAAVPSAPPPSEARSAASTRASRTAPRNTLSNADRQASSPVSATVPPGDPPTLISAPSRRPNRSRAAVISSPGAAGSALSTTAQATAPDPASGVRRAAAAAAVLWCGALSSTRAPSATRARPAANPRPRLPPVTRYTRPASQDHAATLLPGRTPGERDLAARHLDRLGGQRAWCGPGNHAAVLDAELAAMTGAVDSATGDLVHQALQVRADRAERLELTRCGLGDHDLLGGEHLPATDRDLARVGQRRAPACCPDPDVPPDDEPLLPPHAARVAARPAKPAPASAARRVVSRPGQESCVTMTTSGRGRIGAPHAHVARPPAHPGSALRGHVTSC